MKIRRKTLTCFSSVPRCFSFTSTQTSTTHAKLFDINTDDASKILDITSWVHIIFTRIGGGPSLSNNIRAATFQASSCAGGLRMTLRMQWGRRLQQESWIHIPDSTFTAVMRSFSPALFPSLLQYLWTVSYGHGAVQILGTKGRLALMVLRANWMRQE